jgi:DNA-binding response OmpR family regulator
MRLLMVENHAAFADVVRRQFLGGHDVTLVPSLAEARERLRAAPFDALLVDFDLDDGKGDALVRELRGAGAAVHVIAISSHEAGNAALLAAGADACCPKLSFARIAELLERP